MRSLVDIAAPVQQINIIRHLIADDGTFPNNGLLPLLVYRKALNLAERQARSIVKEILESNGWVNAWEGGIYEHHHYHSTAHEVLAVIAGSSRIQFGGPEGVSLLLEEGDVVIIPAGVAHKNMGDEQDLTCIGAYPVGQEYDMNVGKDDERPRADENIKKLDLPGSDPLYGVDGPLLKNWIPEPDDIPETL